MCSFFKIISLPKKTWTLNLNQLCYFYNIRLKEQEEKIDNKFKYVMKADPARGAFVGSEEKAENRKRL